MRSGRNILGWSVRLSLAAMALAGALMLALPGIARALGVHGEAAVWPWAGESIPEAVRQNLLADAGLDVTGDQWRDNLSRWTMLSDAQRLELLARYGRLQGLDRDHRARLVERYNELRRMAPAERDQVRRQAAGLAAFEASLSRQDLAELDSLSAQSRARRLIELWRAANGLK